MSSLVATFERLWAGAIQKMLQVAKVAAKLGAIKITSPTKLALCPKVVTNLRCRTRKDPRIARDLRSNNAYLTSHSSKMGLLMTSSLLRSGIAHMRLHLPTMVTRGRAASQFPYLQHQWSSLPPSTYNQYMLHMLPTLASKIILSTPCMMSWVVNK